MIKGGRVLKAHPPSKILGYVGNNLMQEYEFKCQEMLPHSVLRFLWFIFKIKEIDHRIMA
jgi:hypothetical protein